MAAINQKIQSRISDGLKRFQPIIESAKIRDVSESDTVVMLTGILSEILGYDKYLDITTELAIRGTYCDLALKIDGNLSLLIEAKAIGIELKEQHVKQVVDYAANKGIEWVILTNSVNWRVYKVVFSKPIQNILVCDIDFLKLRPKAIQDIEQLFLLSKEAVSKSSLDEYFTQKQATNRFMVGNLLCEESILNTLKKELKQIYPDIKVTNEEIKTVLTSDVIKRELLTGEEADDARKKIAKANKRKEKLKTEKKPNSPASVEAHETTVTEVTATDPAIVNEN
jgi:predicted type IV restriction endonuclease